MLSSLMICIGVRAPQFGLGGGGGGDLIARKKLHKARERELYTRTQITVKTKTFPIITSNETIIIPKKPRNSDVWNLQRKRKLLLRIG